ncbi:MAG: hypothetical protein KTR16_01390, partial [Acidiferrobacterales bacterium]|nr:hypothetical protein [Acidiferrobacterales bacterium]
MKLIKPSLCFALLILSACGGGSSSGGGSSQIKEKDGVFEGSQTLVISTKDGTIIDQANFGFSASVFENNIAIFDPSFLVEAEINNNRFRAETHTFELS